ncbi:TPA: hypothetical protein DCP15_01200 [Candidatus Uhrbacteria bacterium]|nr:hypothetical protein [Candidatus Uhrbacteria bacterium]
MYSLRLKSALRQGLAATNNEKKGGAMRALFLSIVSVLPLFLTACGSQQEPLIDEAEAGRDMSLFCCMDRDGDKSPSHEPCTGPASGCAWAKTWDCDDGDASINPNAVEIWYDGVDQDCDGHSDYDQDYDSIESAEHGGEDCNDEEFAASPGRNEVFDGVDNDCDGRVDESPTGRWYVDADGDGFGDNGQYAVDTKFIASAVTQTVNYATHGGDCRDDNFHINPEAREYLNGLDDDCDGKIDEDFRD